MRADRRFVTLLADRVDEGISLIMDDVVSYASRLAGRACIWAAFCTLALLLPKGVSAAEVPFTFNVDVAVQDLQPDVSQLHVRCEVYGEKQGVALGRGESQVVLEKRSYAETVTVGVEMIDDQPPQDAQRYACGLRLIIGENKPERPSVQNGNLSLRSKPGTSFVRVLQGSL